MTPEEAILHVQKCVEDENYLVRDHFEEQMSRRFFFWADVLAVVEQPFGARTDGEDEYGRERWFLKGATTGKMEIELFIVFERAAEEGVIFWTIYWE